jgi:hypothetical protein
LDFTTSLHDGWVVAFLLTCAPLGRAVVNFGDDESSDLTSNTEVLRKEQPTHQQQEPAKLFLVPLGIVVIVKFVLNWMARISGNESVENMAEMSRIVHYYASESMLTTNEDERFGTVTVRDHYKRMLQKGKARDEHVESPLGLIASSVLRKKWK